VREDLGPCERSTQGKNSEKGFIVGKKLKHLGGLSKKTQERKQGGALSTKGQGGGGGSENFRRFFSEEKKKKVYGA